LAPRRAQTPHEEFRWVARTRSPNRAGRRRWRGIGALCNIMADEESRRLLLELGTRARTPSSLSERTNIPIRSVRRRLRELLSNRLITRPDPHRDEFRLANAKVAPKPGSTRLTLTTDDGLRLVLEITNGAKSRGRAETST